MTARKKQVCTYTPWVNVLEVESRNSPRPTKEGYIDSTTCTVAPTRPRPRVKRKTFHSFDFPFRIMVYMFTLAEEKEPAERH